MTRYKPCCGLTCLLGNCKTRDAGGCYCVCRLKDSETTLLKLLEGVCYRKGGGIIFESGRTPVPLTGEEKEETLSQLDAVRERLKTYEVGDK